jgi:hypothetical protein
LITYYYLINQENMCANISKWRMLLQ